MHSSISIFYHIFEKENMDHSVSSSSKVYLQLLFIHLTIIREHLFVPRLSPKNITSYYDGKNLCILTTEIKRMSPLPGYGMFNCPLIYCLLKYWWHGYFLYNLLISASVFTTLCSSARYLMLQTHRQVFFSNKSAWSKILMLSMSSKLLPFSSCAWSLDRKFPLHFFIY